MPAYLIARVKVRDAEAYKAYAVESRKAIEAFGGRFLARGGHTNVLEGSDDSDRIVIVEFENMATAEQWYASEQYTKARAMRTPVSDATFVLVEGFQ